MNNNIELLPKKRKDRIKDKMYIDKNNEYVIWSGELKHCIHNKRKRDCVDCNVYVNIIKEKEVVSTVMVQVFANIIKEGTNV